MTKIMAKRILVLQELMSGRKIKHTPTKYVWADGHPSPGLGGDLVSWLYRANMIEDEVKDERKGAYGDNVTGYTVITFSGEFMVKQYKDKIPKKPIHEVGLEVHHLAH